MSLSCEGFIAVKKSGLKLTHRSPIKDIRSEMTLPLGKISVLTSGLLPTHDKESVEGKNYTVW